MQIVVGSENPVKLAVAREACALAFPDRECAVSGVRAESGVDEQPWGTEAMRTGAHTRARHCQEARPEADLFIGIEGGVEDIDGTLFATAWMCAIDQAGRVNHGRASAFPLPTELATRLHAGEELGPATDAVFGTVNAKRAGGAIGALTDGSVTRADFYLHGLYFALLPFRNIDLYH